MTGSHSEIVAAAAEETGGAHNQKGIEFQRNWALLQMMALEDSGASDFLFMFEALQDIAILDSVDNPTSVELYQVKKKDRGEWNWAGLTDLHVPTAKKKKPLAGVAASLFGKLHATMRRLKTFKSNARFISNAGCDLDLEDGNNASTSLPIDLSKLAQPYRHLLNAAFTAAYPGESIDLSRLSVEQVDLPPSDAITYTIGKASAFLAKRSAKHAGQARSFVESLLAKIGPLGAGTEKCATFEQVKSQHGFARAEFTAALASLETVPDMDFLLDTWLKQLHAEGSGFRMVTSIKLAVAAIYQRRVLGSLTNDDLSICESCDIWISSQPDPVELLPYLAAATKHLKGLHPKQRDPNLQAHFLLQAIKKCADQT